MLNLFSRKDWKKELQKEKPRMKQDGAIKREYRKVVSMDQMQVMMENSLRTMELAEQLTREQGVLPPLSIIMAGDLLSAEHWEAAFKARKISFKKACSLIGSYARFDFAVRMMNEHWVKPEDVYSDLCSLWASSDPDDTRLAYLWIFRDAFVANGNRILRDEMGWGELGKRRTIRVYRGDISTQSPVGFAWTLRKEIAVKFANGAGVRRLVDGGVVRSGVVHRKDVLAYITGRDEHEIIVPAHCVDEIKLTPIKLEVSDE